MSNIENPLTKNFPRSSILVARLGVASSMFADRRPSDALFILAQTPLKDDKKSQSRKSPLSAKVAREVTNQMVEATMKHSPAGAEKVVLDLSKKTRILPPIDMAHENAIDIVLASRWIFDGLVMQEPLTGETDEFNRWFMLAAQDIAATTLPTDLSISEERPTKRFPFFGKLHRKKS